MKDGGSEWVSLGIKKHILEMGSFVWEIITVVQIQVRHETCSFDGLSH